jgi:hypothetical protein
MLMITAAISATDGSSKWRRKASSRSTGVSTWNDRISVAVPTVVLMTPPRRATWEAGLMSVVRGRLLAGRKMVQDVFRET